MINKKGITLRFLKFRYTYKVMFAHKPLCERFRKNVIKVGNLYICRGCSFIYLGLISSSILLVLFHNINVKIRTYNTSNLINTAGILLTFITVLFSYPKIYRKLNRVICDLIRFSLGSIIVCNVYFALFYRCLINISILIILYIIKKNFVKLRAETKLTSCNGCIELNTGGICSGYIIQSEYIRKFEEEATNYLMSISYIPKIKKGSKK